MLRGFLLPCLAFLTSLLALAANPVRDRFVEAALIAETEAIVPGKPFTVGLRLRHDPGWHTYWKVTATGYAPSLDWKLPPGFVAGPIQWATPAVYELLGQVEYVYEHEVLLLVEIQAPASLPLGGQVPLQAVAEWLMCEKTCVPGKAALKLSLPVRAEAGPTRAEFSAARERLPQLRDLSLRAGRTGKTLWLEVPAGTDSAQDLYFFDEQALIIPHKQQEWTRLADGRRVLRLEADPTGDAQASALRGVLAARQGGWSADGRHPGLTVAVPLAAEPVPTGLAETKKAPAGTDPAARSLPALLGLAFIGGLILNLMPCVFPVLGIKIMGFVGQAGQNRRKVMLHSLTFTAGVLLSFWLLATVLLILRAGGGQLGWGFQLQSAAFVYGLAAFLLLFGLNMSGLFEVGQSAVGVGANLTAKEGLGGSFASGVLATVVATPCAAPFLAPALGAALALPAVSSLALFTAIGLGLALPYLLLSAFPALLRFLPRPGAWMEAFKQGLAFLLYGTVAYLLWVLAGQLTEEGGFAPQTLLASLLGLVALAAAAWVYGRWCALHLRARTRLLGLTVALLLGGGGLYWGYPQAIDQNPAHAAAPVVWQTWEPGLPERLAAEGRIVYVDFTARWCVTCQTNKAAVFSSDAVLQAFAARKVVALKADWTNRNAAITEELAQYGRSAVPFNLIYHPGTGAPQILPELLTPGTVLTALGAASAPGPQAED